MLSLRQATAILSEFAFINLSSISHNIYKLFSMSHKFMLSPRDKKKTLYVKSELRLIETLDGICDRVLQYNIHKVARAGKYP